MAIDSHLKRQLIRYRDLLANLSRRNRELYFKESKGSSINLSKSPFPQSAFHENHKSVFRPIRSLDPSFDELLKGNEFDLHKHFQFDDLKHRETLTKLNNKLDKIRLADDRHQREFGISGAWLLGPFLCWRTSAQAAKADLLISPIIKVPVDLKKNKQMRLQLVAEDENFSLNPSLRLMLKQNLGFDIPESLTFATVSEVVNYLKDGLAKVNKHLTIADSTTDTIPKVPGRYKVIRDEHGEIIEKKATTLEEELSEKDLAVYTDVTATNFLIIDVVYLDQLNATRTVLINDYETILENASDHPILNELFNGTPLAEEPTLDRSRLKELDAYRERDNHFVVNIDSTQHRAIDKATKSRAIVIQGPPGTGKSQTITNLIADFIAKGKRVLFVSEKRPALDVVYNRLKSANIDSQAVLIHSSDLNKSDLYKSFLELAESEPSASGEREWQNTAETLDRVKSDINGYAESIKSEHLPSRLPVAEVLLLSSSTDKRLFNPEIKRLFCNLDLDQLKNLTDDLEEIRQVLKGLEDFRTSPWITRHTTTIKSATMLHSLGEIRLAIMQAASEITQKEQEFLSITGEHAIKAIAEVLSSFRNAYHSGNTVPAEYGPLWNALGDDPVAALERLKSLIGQHLGELETHFSRHQSIRPDTDPAAISHLEEYYKHPRGLKDWFSGPFWKSRTTRMKVCPTWDGTHLQFESHRKYRTSFDALMRIVATVSPTHVHKESDLETIKSWCERAQTNITQLSRFFTDAKQSLPKKLLAQAIGSHAGYVRTISDIADSSKCFEGIERIYAQATAAWHKLLNHLMVLPPMPRDLTEAATLVSQLASRVDDLDILDKAELLITTATTRSGIANLKAVILTTLGPVEVEWVKVIESSVFNGWAEDVTAKYPALRSFSREHFVARIDSFKTQETKHRQTARQAVHNAFAKRWTATSDRSGLPLLRKESTKQRRVLSPREIMEKGALKTMMQLKPCWLMSPLSISQMLPVEKGLFDVIIFDEASQVRVEDAVPSIYRANSMIVVGDNKQMPPTSFFSGALSDDAEEDEEPISDSVLDLASTVYPSVLLEWHYRSRSEALIAFSNRAFYGGRLIAAPNPSTLTASRAIKFMEVANAYFTTKSGNETEAKLVIDNLILLLEKNDRRSYGVIAMGQSQAVALEEAMDRRMADDPKARTLLERAMNFKDGEADAGLFIKNLENVQGDERDVILMSVGYAPSAPGKKLYQNFGPLSKQGGGRRLNVAITRAKSEMYVFASFPPSSISTDEEMFNHNLNLCIFGRYLKYAKAISEEQVEVAMGILDSFGMGGVITHRKSSRFALDVKRRLEELGHKVTAEIGSSGFYIDLGIHHPVIQSNYLLGIECDGAVFHSTPYARDRDKIREDLLTGRGWRIARVWSQDWSKDWKTELSRLDAEIRRIIEQPEQLKRASNE